MGQPHKPRSGSMQFWHRKRARRAYPRIRTLVSVGPKLLGFMGYKAGMTHLIITDNRQKSLTKGKSISMPVTIIECPPMKVSSVRFYKNSPYGPKVVTEIQNKLDKDLGRKMILPKKEQERKIGDINSEDYDMIKLQVYTQPRKTGFGKKKPEVFEIFVGGSKEEQLNYAKEVMDREIPITEIFKEGQQLDIHAVTKGKGLQGPVRRFGVALRSHKSEKTKRGPGSLGAWRGQGHMMYRVSHAGQMGYHTRTEYNKWIIKIGNKPEDVNPKGGFINYGIVRSDYIIVKGSVSGSKKRSIVITPAVRPNSLIPNQAPSIEYISKESKQGR